MTSLAAWIAQDSRGPSSIYFVSDSRYSWPDGRVLDTGLKTFTCKTTPDMFSFFGSTLVPSKIFPELLGSIERNNILSTANNLLTKKEYIFEFIKKVSTEHPDLGQGDFVILYATRVGNGLAGKFYVECFSWDQKQKKLNMNEMGLHPDNLKSELIFYNGSGRDSIHEWMEKWRVSDAGRTSRAIFSGFCDSIRSGQDPLTGGPPQIVGLYRKGSAMDQGVFYQGVPYFRAQVIKKALPFEVEWRNELFERCEYPSGERIETAQRHARPGQL